MNLQQHYDLIGQILKERPELASYEVLDCLRQEPCWQVLADHELKCLRLVPKERYMKEEFEVVIWQHQ